MGGDWPARAHARKDPRASGASGRSRALPHAPKRAGFTRHLVPLVARVRSLDRAREPEVEELEHAPGEADVIGLEVAVERHALLVRAVVNELERRRQRMRVHEQLTVRHRHDAAVRRPLSAGERARHIAERAAV